MDDEKGPTRAIVQQLRSRPAMNFVRKSCDFVDHLQISRAHIERLDEVVVPNRAWKLSRSTLRELQPSK